VDEDRESSFREQLASPGPQHPEGLAARRAGEFEGEDCATIVQQPVLPSGGSLLREDFEGGSSGSPQRMTPEMPRRESFQGSGRIISSPASPAAVKANGGLVEAALKFPGVAGGGSAKEIEEADLLFVPDDDQEWQRPRRPPPGDHFGPSKQLTGPILPVSPANAKPEAQHEEEEWMERKRVTGVIGRLVQYQMGEIPSKDVLGLHRTCQGRLMVTAVRGDGPAARAGVVAGDQLISINGEKIWEYYPAKAVLSGVRGPATLIFLGFSGKLQAEVRVKQPDEPRLGLPAQVSVSTKVLQKSKREEDRRRRWVEVQKPSNPPSLRLLDPVVFEQRCSSSLLIATEAEGEQADVQPAPPPPQLGVYELHQQDAREILYQALRAQPLSMPSEATVSQHRVSSRQSDVVNF